MRASISNLDRRQFLAALAAAPAVSLETSKTNKPATPPAPAILNINDVLEPIRAAAKVPALTGAALVEGKLKAVGAVGIRKGGTPSLVKGTDLWHVGSVAKTMTATLIGLNVEKRVLGWDTTISEALPDLRDAMHASYRDVSLKQLLYHRSGIPAKVDSKTQDAIWAHRGTPTEQRVDMAKAVLAAEPSAEPDKEFIYSNQNYIIAAAMLERAASQSYEGMMRDQLFKPLQMSMSGFGVPGTIGQVDQPWGHKWKNGKLEPQQADNPPAIAPAAGVHCSIWDFARFAQFHLRGARGDAQLLKKITFDILHEPHPAQDYAMGWRRLEREWAKDYVLMHDGSNTINFATLWVAPEVNFAAMAATNIGGDSGEKACDDAVQALIKKFVLNQG